MLNNEYLGAGLKVGFSDAGSTSVELEAGQTYLVSTDADGAHIRIDEVSASASVNDLQIQTESGAIEIVAGVLSRFLHVIGKSGASGNVMAAKRGFAS